MSTATATVSRTASTALGTTIRTTVSTGPVDTLDTPTGTRWRVRPVPVRTPPPLELVPEPAPDNSAASIAIQDTLDLELPRSRGHLRLLGDNEVAPQLTPLAHLPDAEDFCARIALTLIEVISGRRPLTHVGRVTSPEVYTSLERRRIGGRNNDHRMRPSRVRRVVGGSPREGVFDAVVIIDDQRRVRAMALRLLGVDGRWLITELRLT